MSADLELVLPVEAAASSEPQTFGSAFPGAWAPGVAQSVSSLGLTPEAALDLLTAHNLPLVPASAPAAPRGARRGKKAQEDAETVDEPGNAGERDPEPSPEAEA